MQRATPKKAESDRQDRSCCRAAQKMIQLLAGKRAEAPAEKESTSPRSSVISAGRTKEKADRLHFSGVSHSGMSDTEERDNASLICDQLGKQNKETAMSLILFEEVDVIFEDDVGFVAAIRSFVTTTKRPVVLTSNDPFLRERFSCSLEASVCSYLQLTVSG
uniref:ATPase family, AAA domain containing 5a n=1 Tax=Nothobranchius korthausae TaxID=1143690 RepID=A0A1A8HAV7_9TELE